ncbi:unnamed protein product [Durusdinium trenchii]|uniref:Uncharacterized protein n=1 Tax=Durusdinium trenchii TaxID=1381693 RepID=A0ABP0JD16_9DINO
MSDDYVPGCFLKLLRRSHIEGDENQEAAFEAPTVPAPVAFAPTEVPPPPQAPTARAVPPAPPAPTAPAAPPAPPAPTAPDACPPQQSSTPAGVPHEVVLRKAPNDKSIHWSASGRFTHNNKKFQDGGVARILSQLPDTLYHDEVDFSNNELTSIGMASVVAICKRSSSRLKVLKLFKNSIADDCVAHFEDLLKSCRNLREVHLSHNNLSHHGVLKLAECVARSSRAEPLWLRVEHNSFKAPGELLKDLEKNYRACPRLAACKQFWCSRGSPLHVPFLGEVSSRLTLRSRSRTRERRDRLSDSRSRRERREFRERSRRRDSRERERRQGRDRERVRERGMEERDRARERREVEERDRARDRREPQERERARDRREAEERERAQEKEPEERDRAQERREAEERRTRERREAQEGERVRERRAAEERERARKRAEEGERARAAHERREAEERRREAEERRREAEERERARKRAEERERARAAWERREAEERERARGRAGAVKRSNICIYPLNGKEWGSQVGTGFSKRHRHGWPLTGAQIVANVSA